MIKMAQLEDIRKMYFMEGLSIREINRRTGIHRDTISKYISLEEPKPPKYKLTKERTHPVLGPYIPMIKQIIEDDKTRHRKQRHTGQKYLRHLKRRLFRRLQHCNGLPEKGIPKTKGSFPATGVRVGSICRSRLDRSIFYLKGKEPRHICL